MGEAIISVCLFEPSVKASRTSTWDLEQDYGSITLHRARLREGACRSEVVLITPSWWPLPLGHWLTAWKHPVHGGKTRNRRVTILGDIAENQEWGHSHRPADRALLIIVTSEIVNLWDVVQYE